MNCLLCDRDVTEYPSVNVDFEGRVEPICTDCMEKADEPDELFDWNREGQPEFTGVFG